MAQEQRGANGSVVALWRYPVKSMMGEELNACELTNRGVLGDRAYALVDPTNGKVVSAKNPRKWGNLFSFQARYAAPPQRGEAMPPVTITLPEGSTHSSEDGDVEKALSEALGRDVRLETAAPDEPSLEEYWPDMEELDHRDTVTDEAMPTGTFFDLAVVHILTTATLSRLGELYPEGRFEARRFRPNIVVEAASDEHAFVENDWIGHSVSIGEDVQLAITEACPRCVMTTLSQGDLPRDRGILRTAAKHNDVHVGVYAAVIKGGTIHRGDNITVGQPTEG
jgi:uncharacterized protein YcbX